MNTPSHFLMTAALRKAMPQRRILASAFLLGSVAPDIPLYLLSCAGIVYFHFVLGWPMDATAQHMFDDLYFHDRGWMAAHNMLHAPIVLGVLLGVGHRFRERFRAANWLRWFAWACLLHSVVDIFTHNNDGPLLLFPFDWSFRFESAISYWDHRYYGRTFAAFELALDALFVAYLVGPWLYERFRARREAHTE